MWIHYWPQLLFVAVFGGIIYVGSWNHDEEAHSDLSAYNYRVKNCKYAAVAVAVVYFCHRIFRPNIYELFKPFERIWRVHANIVCLYLYLLVFIYMMNPYDARKFWGFIEERLGKPVTKEYHTYDDDCDFTWVNILDNMDHYFLAHFCNWFVAAMILRDAYMLHAWSLLDEILELSAQYKLPHFRECWWDHIFHDFLITNTPAIILGLKFCDFLGLQKYDWLGRWNKSSISDWKVFNDHFRFFGILQVYFIISANFLTGFFMINALWIPPLSIPTVTRLYIWFLLGNIVFKEGYNMLERRENPATKDEYVEPTYRWV